ncbi:hypothetical protein VTJ83DRAFT_7366 [Remersonia thermophila]|uniref:Uncharacterized protein n=1 Tax=Remersonia thermophila TaxID=72144 RepID=A0ABR4D399_9PEZI
MRPTSTLAAGAAVVAVFVNGALAGFTNSFEGLTSGSAITLSWQEGDAQAQHYPLSITAQVIERSSSGFSANAYSVNLTTDASGTSFTWTNAPHPLRWIQDGLYQLELRPANWGGPNVPLLARSPHFTISKPAPAATSSSSSSPTPDNNDSGSGISTPVAVGVGITVGVLSVMATAIITWRMRKRKRQADLEKQKLKRSEFVIS